MSLCFWRSQISFCISWYENCIFLVMDDGLSRCILYKGMIQTTFSVLTNKNLQWKEKRRHEFQSCNGEFFKREQVLQCDANRLYVLCSDRHYETLVYWNAQAAQETQIREHFETVDGNIYYMDKTPLGFRGIQWNREPKIVLYRSVDEFPVKMIGFWINVLEDYKTLLTVIANFTIPTDFKMLERVCRDSPLFLSIYNPWKCEICRKMVPAHEIECRICRRARYWRCQNLECYEAQMDKTDTCRHCGRKKD